MNKQHRYFHLLTVIIFSLFISVPLITTLLSSKNKLSIKEKRNLTAIPSLPISKKDIIDYPKKFDKYYSDNFGFRSWYLGYYNNLKYSIGDSPKDNTFIIGKEGWSFLGSIKHKFQKKYGDPIGDYRNINQYTSAQLQHVAEYLAGVQKWLKSQNIEYYLIIAPNKHTIYSEKLPDYIHRVNKKSATDQLVTYLRKHTNVEVIDLRSALLNAKKSGILYYKTGTHWNFKGGNIAQFEIMKVIQKKFPNQIYPELYDDSIFHYKIATDRWFDRQIEKSKNSIITTAPYPLFPNESEMTTDYKKGNNNEDLGKITHTNVNDSQSLKAVIFRDSFFRVLEPYFTRKFNRSTYIWKSTNLPILRKYIQSEKPDIVIEEWVERTLPYTPKNYKVFSKISHL